MIRSLVLVISLGGTLACGAALEPMDQLSQITPTPLRGAILTIPEAALIEYRPNAVLDPQAGFAPVINSRDPEPRTQQVERVYTETIRVDGILRAQYYVPVGPDPYVTEIIAFYVDADVARAHFDARYRGRGVPTSGVGPAVSIQTRTYAAKVTLFEDKIIFSVPTDPRKWQKATVTK